MFIHWIVKLKIKKKTNLSRLLTEMILIRHWFVEFWDFLSTAHTRELNSPFSFPNKRCKVCLNTSVSWNAYVSLCPKSASSLVAIYLAFLRTNTRISSFNNDITHPLTLKFDSNNRTIPLFSIGRPDWPKIRTLGWSSILDSKFPWHRLVFFPTIF